MADANGPRRALNVHGTDALDLRTFKKNGDPWDFNLRRDREEALQRIDDEKPTWLIGSPPCTYFSAWQNNQIQEHNSRGGFKETGDGWSPSQVCSKGIPETDPSWSLLFARASQWRLIMEGGQHTVHLTSAQSGNNQMRPMHVWLHRGLHKA